MDILHYLKTHHEAINAASDRLGPVHGTKERRHQVEALVRAAQVYLHLEKDYLYPEIIGLFPGAEQLVERAEANAAMIDKRLKALVKVTTKPASEQQGFADKLRDLQAALHVHFDQEEQILMPKMRSAIRTEDREDLGQVFADAEADALAHGAASDAESAATPSAGRKRA